MEKKILIARQIASLLTPLSEKGIEKLSSILVRRESPKGSLVLAEGEVSKHVGFVHKGLIRQFYYKNKKDTTEHFACEGQMFLSIESFILEKPTRLMVESIEHTIIYGIPRNALLSLAKDDYEMDQLYHSILEKSLILSQLKTDSFRFETANERYARFMKEHPKIIQRAPLSYIASYLLMTPETLSRVRANII